MVGMVVGDEDGFERVRGGSFDPGDDGEGVGDEKRGVDEDARFGAHDEGGYAVEAGSAGGVDVGLEEGFGVGFLGLWRFWHCRCFA